MGVENITDKFDFVTSVSKIDKLDDLESYLSNYIDNSVQIDQVDLLDFSSSSNHHQSIAEPKKHMTLVEKGLKGLLDTTEVPELIDLVGTENLLKFGLESHIDYNAFNKIWAPNTTGV